MSDSDAMPYVYIIYFPDDQDLVERLVIDLVDHGFPAKITPQELRYGSPLWIQAAETAIKAASSVLVINSFDSIGAGFAAKLWDVARQYNRSVREVSLRDIDINVSDPHTALIDQIVRMYELHAAPPMAAPEPEFDLADDIAAESSLAPGDWASLSADSAVPPPPPIPPPQAHPIPNPRPMEPPAAARPVPQPMPSPKPSKPMPATPAPRPPIGAPAPAMAPGSAAGPVPDFDSQYGGRGGGASAGKVSPGREDNRQRSVDAPAVERASKKSAFIEDFKQAETEAPEAASAMPAVEDVHFTAFRPETVPVAQWLTLLVYAHADRVRDLISVDAEKFADQMGGKPKAVQGKAAAQLERGTELRIVPTCDGVQFNPESISVKWIEDWHRAEFRFQAESGLSGTEDVARVAIYVGPVLIGQIKLALSFTTAPPIPAPTILSVITGRGKAKTRGKLKPTSAKMYEARQIFLSYSHADTNIVLACRDACKRLGFIPLIDIDTLRAGQHWNDELMNMIERADIFQLFWSERSAQSKYVQQEWEYALQLIKDKAKSPDFIRPTYWEKPPAPIPEPLADIHFDYTPAVG
jgi:hypothetical protein